ncbi:MAG: FKBP-type peptidyl-prolyl cis-trans isomerase [Chitinophagales bacterium]
MNITENAVVQMHYKLTNKEGMLLDSSEGREPLTYMHGKQMLIPGLENQLNGKEVGNKFVAEVPAAEAYGQKSDEMIHLVPKENFKGDGELKPGLQIQIDTNQGQQMAIITKVEGNDVTIDMNHPLAGMDLSFDVEIVDIREATKEEIEHGHVHGPGGHQH